MEFLHRNYSGNWPLRGVKRRCESAMNVWAGNTYVFHSGIEGPARHAAHAAHLVAGVDGSVAAGEDVDHGAHDRQTAPLRVVRELRTPDTDSCKWSRDPEWISLFLFSMNKDTWVDQTRFPLLPFLSRDATQKTKRALTFPLYRLLTRRNLTLQDLILQRTCVPQTLRIENDVNSISCCCGLSTALLWQKEEVNASAFLLCAICPFVAVEGVNYNKYLSTKRHVPFLLVRSKLCTGSQCGRVQRREALTNQPWLQLFLSQRALQEKWDFSFNNLAAEKN